MFSIRRTTQHSPLRIAWVVLLVLTAFPHALVSQVRDLPVEKKSNLLYENPVYSTDGSPALRGSPMDPVSRRIYNADILPIPQNDLVNRRIKVNVSKRFKDQKMELIVQRFEQLFSKQLADAQIPPRHLFPGFLQNIVLGTSGLWEQEGFWQAHLQRADYELISSELSLNDINRFQFRKNRMNGDSMPKRPVAGGTSILITDE